MNLSPHPASPDLTLPESVEEAFTLLQETLGFDRLAARQDVDGTIRPDEIETFSATKTLLESLPEVRIEGACEGPAEFKLGQTLGEGGMGVVRLADQVSLHRSVAVKTLRPEKSSDAALLALLREAWVTGALEHPNIVPVYALGRNEEKMPVFVMKRVEGTPWSTLLADPTHPLVARGGGDKDPLHFHLELLLKVCDALAFAHSRQLIHRDVKPENVMLGAFGEVYLLDWGIAVSLDDTSLFPKASEVRSVPRRFNKDQSGSSDQTKLTQLTDGQRWKLYSPWLGAPDAAIRANATICLIHQANYLLDRQIAALESAFVEGGGYSEQLATERLRKRKEDRTDQANPTDLKPPVCPQCGGLMALRTAKAGKTPGSQFWGCTNYPDCKGTAQV